MTTATFDTHRFINRLKDAGLNEKQAEAMTDAVMEINDGADLVTKRDLALANAETKRDMAEMKYDLLKWVIGLAMAQLALLIGLVMRLPH